MKMLKRVLSITALVALVGGAALAAVDNSHHDLKAWSNGTTQEVCLYCHGVTSTVTNAGYGNIGDLCVSRCHIGAAGYGADAQVEPNRPASINEDGTPDTANNTLNAINTGVGYGHGLTKALLLGPYGTGTETFGAGTGANLPYAGNATIECTSCHDVHNSLNTPFLQEDLFSAGTTGRSFCEYCHTLRGSNWSAGSTVPNGEHPVNFAMVIGNSPRDAANDVERLGRYIALDVASDGTEVFAVQSPNGAALGGPKGTANSHYITGGKVSGFSSTATAAGKTFGCYTCHSAHMDNMEAGKVRPNLVLRDTVSANGQWNPLCVGCHGNVANGLDDPNPGLRPAGATEWFYHPVGTTANAALGVASNIGTYMTSTGTFSFQVNLAPLITLPNQGGTANGCGIETTTYRPRCTSCHDVHGGINNSQALLDLDGTRNGTFAGNICDACHNGVGLPDVADNAGQAGEQKAAGAQGSHHRTRAGSWAAGTIRDSANEDDLIIDAASWGSATTASLDCADCHVFANDVHQTAHNW